MISCHVSSTFQNLLANLIPHCAFQVIELQVDFMCSFPRQNRVVWMVLVQLLIPIYTNAENIGKPVWKFAFLLEDYG